MLDVIFWLYECCWINRRANDYRYTWFKFVLAQHFVMYELK